VTWAQEPTVSEACGQEQPSFICRRALEWTGSEAWAEAADKLLAKPLQILLIMAVAFVVNRLVRRAIRRLTARIADPGAQEVITNLKRRAPGGASSSAVSLRSAARAETLGHVLRSIASMVIWTIAGAMILGELGVNLGPLIAGAGIAGVALGFGAQSLVKDFITGIFMLVEDQFGVGDIIDAGPATGTVEAVTLRSTRLRDVEGTVWHIPNGTILRIGNHSQQWARALLDVEVAYGSDIDRVEAEIKEVADRLWRDPAWQGKVLEEPEVWGVERVEPEVVAVRLVVKTRPGAQYPVMRELRRRLTDAFVDAGITLRSPQADSWARRGPDVPTPPPEPDDAEAG
jgi:small conductance mechanosensitive channel